jgi:WD40 repeat protein
MLLTNHKFKEAVLLTVALGFAVEAHADQDATAKKEPKSYDRVGLNALAFTADGSLAVTGGQDGVVAVWDLRRNRHSQTIRIGKPVNALALAPDGKLLAVGCDAKPGVRLWSRGADGFSAQHEMPERWNCGAVAISPDGKMLACGGEGHGTMHIHDLAAKRRIGRFYEPSNFTSALVFSPDGKRLASAGNDIICWDLSPESLHKTRSERENQTGEELKADAAQALLWRAKHTDEYSADVAFSADSKLLAGVTGVGRLESGGHTLRVWDAASGKLLQTIAWEKMTCVTFLPGGKQVVTGHDDGQLTVWNVEAEQSARQWQGHTKAVRAVMVVPGSSDLATVGADGAFQTWDPATGRLKHRFSHRLGKASVG